MFYIGRENPKEPRVGDIPTSPKTTEVKTLYTNDFLYDLFTMKNFKR